MRCKALKPTSDSRLQDFVGTLQSIEAYTPKISGQGYFIFPEIPGVYLRFQATGFSGYVAKLEAYTPKIPGQGYFIFPEIPGVHVNSP